MITSKSLPESPERIVSLAPNVTEILFAVGAGDRVVGVTRFCDHPPEVEELPTIGGVIDPDLEAILARKPDLVVGVTSGSNPSVRDKLDSADLPYAFLEMDDVSETYGGIRELGALVGREDAAGRVVEEMRAEMEKWTVESADERPRVLFVYGHKPLTAAGPGTFGDELVKMAGGRNVFGEADSKYPKVDMEKVLEIDPDRIIDASMGGSAPGDFWQTYDSLGAVKNGQVHRLPDPVVLRPAPRLAEGLRLVREAIRSDSEASEQP